MDISITPGKLHGEIRAIPSKSDVHRLLICTALADKATNLFYSGTSGDINATLSCIKSLGAKITEIPGGIQVAPVSDRHSGVSLDCAESGSTLRFLLPVAAVLAEKTVFLGSKRLGERPLSPLLSEMEAHGCIFDKNHVLTEDTGVILSMASRLKAGKFTLPGNISSQFISGLLFAFPLLPEHSELIVLPPVESKGYIDMTVNTLARFGVTVSYSETASGMRRYTVSGKYRSPSEVFAEGDWSNSAFWLTADILGGNVRCTGLSTDSKQSDKRIAELLRLFENPSGEIEINVSEIPDLVPILAVAAAASSVTVRITGASRLRLKESDRLSAVANNLHAVGGNVTEMSDGLIINGKSRLRGGTISGYNDHRIVMAFAISACICEENVVIKGAEAVNKSYPQFFEDYKKLGGVFHVVQFR